jgi:RHS repeat-associated protein
MPTRKLRFASMITVIAIICQVLAPGMVQARRPPTAPPRGASAVSETRPGRPEELPERRSANSKTYRNPDGTFTTEVFAKAVHYADARGQFHPIENTLVAGVDGDTIRNAANRYQVTFAKRSGNEFFRLNYQGRQLRMDLKGGQLRTAEWSGDVLTYKGVQENVDLRYTVAADHVKEEIVLLSPDVPAQYEFRLHSPGLKADRTPNGHRFRDTASGVQVFAIPRMYMKDAAGAISGQVLVEVKETGSLFTLTVTPDAEWLRDPARVYPVAVDPTIAIAPDYSGGLDTTISSLDGLDDVNLGYDTALTVGNGAAALLKFDLSAIPRNAIIDSARLELSSLAQAPTPMSSLTPGQAASLKVSAQPGTFPADTYSVLYTYVTEQGAETKASPSATLALTANQAMEVDTGALPAGAISVKIYVGKAGAERLARSTAGGTVTLFDPAATTASKPPTASWFTAPSAQPTVAAAAAPAGTSGFPAGSYYVRYSYVTAEGESALSPAPAEPSVTVTAGQGISVTLPAFPAGVGSANIYLGTTADEATLTRLGNTRVSTVTVYGNPPALLGTPAPQPAAVYLADPLSAPFEITAQGANTLWPAGTYSLAYTYYGANGETQRSDAGTVTLTAGKYPRLVVSEMAFPLGALGLRAYLLMPDGTWLLAATQPAKPRAVLLGDPARPWVDVVSPPGFHNVSAVAGTTSGPTVTATLTTAGGRLLPGAYEVAATWVLPGAESRLSTTAAATVSAYGKGIKVTASNTKPATAVGMRAYIRPAGTTTWWLAGASESAQVIVTGDPATPAAPPANTTQLPAPKVDAVTPSALPAGTYYVAYTTTTPTTESAPSQAAEVPVSGSQVIDVTIADLGTNSANVYMGTSTTNMRLVAGTTTGNVTITSYPPADAKVLTQALSSDIAAPAFTLRTPAGLGSGSYPVRYTYTDGVTETAPSALRSVSVATGQVISVVVPPLPPGMTGANVYSEVPRVGPVRLATQVIPGQPLLITSMPTQTTGPIPAQWAMAAPSVSSLDMAGTYPSVPNMPGTYYVSYSYYRGSSESARSPEAQVSVLSGSALAVAPIAAPQQGTWDGVRIYVGKEPGAGQLTATAAFGAGVTVKTFVPLGVSVLAVTSPWTEPDATWLHSTDNGLWYRAGGDAARDGLGARLAPGARATADLSALVRGWVTGSAYNYGVLLRSDGSMVSFASSDHPDAALRPALRVTYRSLQAPPQVTITAPNAGYVLNNGTIRLTANVATTDPTVAISRVEFYVNGMLVGTANTPAAVFAQWPTAGPSLFSVASIAPAVSGYSVDWNTANVPAGSYDIEVRAYDSAGQMGSSAWTSVLSDPFNDSAGLNQAATTARFDAGAGAVVLPADQAQVAINPATVTASSSLGGKNYPAADMLDDNKETFWRSPGRSTASAEESVTFRVSSTASGTVTVTPRNPQDGLTFRLQSINSAGDVTAEAGPVTLDAAKGLTFGAGATALRLVFGNLRGNVTTGLYHAEIAEVDGVTQVADTLGYQATYNTAALTDGRDDTAWVSAGKPTPVDTETVEFTVNGPANLLYIKPRTHGVSATISRAEQPGLPLMTIPTLQEGYYSLPAVPAGTRLRIALTSLLSDGAGGAKTQYFAGIADITAYNATFSGADADPQTMRARVESMPIKLPQAATEFLLEVQDSHPGQSQVTYSLYDGTQWHAITPGEPLPPIPATSTVTLAAELTTQSLRELPVLSTWRLSARKPRTITLGAMKDTIPPTVTLAPVTGVLSGLATLQYTASDNVGIAGVELFADNGKALTLAPEPSREGELTFDTKQLKAGDHLLWIRVRDAAGNTADTRPGTTTLSALSDTFTTADGINLASTGVFSSTDRAVISGMPWKYGLLEGTRSASKSNFKVTPGWVDVYSYGGWDAEGNCVAGNLKITDYSSAAVLAEDIGAAGDCYLEARYYETATNNISVTVSYPNAADPVSAELYYNPGSFSVDPDGWKYDYEYSWVESKPIRTEGMITGVTLQATDNRASGTDVQFDFSVDGGITWTPATPGVYTPVGPNAHIGNRLIVNAYLYGATSGTSEYVNVPAKVYDWSAEVTQYLPGGVATISQYAVPQNLRGTYTPPVEGQPGVYIGGRADLEFDGVVSPSQRPGSTYTYTTYYRVYRSTLPNPGTESDLVGVAQSKGAVKALFSDGSNLLRNSSFESRTQGTAVPGWAPTVAGGKGGTIDTTTAWANLQSLKMANTTTTSYPSIYQEVTTWPDGTPLSVDSEGKLFTAAASLKTLGVDENSAASGVKLTLYYADGSDSASSGLPGGTTDWNRREAWVWAEKPVVKARVTLELTGTGTLWFDGVGLDTVRGDWNAGGFEPGRTYYYRVTTVDDPWNLSDPTAWESAPSNEWSTATPSATVPDRLGVKGFWPYAAVDLPGGPGYVNLSNGNLAHAVTDMVYPGQVLAMAFRRTYNSMGGAVSDDLGFGWDHNYNWTLTPSGQDYVLKEGDGSRFTFKWDAASGKFLTPAGSRMRLVVNTDGTATVVRHDNNMLYRFLADGRLDFVAEPNGNTLGLQYDGANRLIRVVGRDALEFAYDAANRIETITHRLLNTTPVEPARTTSFRYDAQGDLISATDAEGHTTFYTYDTLHRLTAVTSALNHTTQLAYAESGELARVQYADSIAQTFAYGGAVTDQPQWSTTTVTNALGFDAQYQLDKNGLLKQQTFKYGAATLSASKTANVKFEHDEQYNVTGYTDARGYRYQITYDEFGNVHSVTDPLGNITLAEWQAKDYPNLKHPADATQLIAPSGQLVNTISRTIDALGGITSYTTDAKGNVTEIRNALQQFTFTYDLATGLRLSATDPNGNRTRYEYDQGWLVKEIQPWGHEVRYQYDEAGSPVRMFRAANAQDTGFKTEYTYDRLGRQTTVQYSDGGVTSFLYDAVGNLIQAVDPAGAITRYSYDNRDRTIALYQYPNANAGDVWVDDSDLPAGLVYYKTTYEYDASGQAVALTDPRGKRWTNTYDGVGRQLTSTDPLNHTWTYTYDAIGNMVTVKEPTGITRTAMYDPLNRRVKTEVPNLLSLTVTYDTLGRQTSTEDKLGNKTMYHYDAVGRLSTVVDPLGFWTRYVYDATGNKTAVVDAQRRTTQYVYDAANRLIEEKRPDGLSVYNRYDGYGRLEAVTNARNQTIAYTYDSLSRLRKITYPDSRSVSYTYDRAGRRTSMTDWTGTTRYQYNLLGWLQSKEDPWGHQVAYQYDEVGNRTAMNLRYTGVDLSWTYAYDAAGHLTNLQAPMVPAANTFTYDNNNRLTAIKYANGDNVAYTYNAADLVTKIKSTNTKAPGTDSTTGEELSGLMTFSYTYDGAGRRTNVARSGKGVVDATTAYTYDNGSRLTAAGPSATSTDRDYYYDLVGNRHTLVADGIGATTYVYDAANRVIEQFGPNLVGGGRYHESYQYDSDGNQIQSDRDGAVSTYTYDEDARLTTVTNPLGQVTKHTYNGDGQRVRMEEPEGTTIFIYDGNEVLAEADATGTITIAYTRRPDDGRLISQWQKGETYWYHLDVLTSTILITDDAGTIKNKYGYDEFGNPSSQTTEGIFNRYTFTGQAWDATSGLYNYKARYYNPQVGRFLTQDRWKGSAWQPWTQNLYAYVGNNPINLIDPTGNRPAMPLNDEYETDEPASPDDGGSSGGTTAPSGGSTETPQETIAPLAGAPAPSTDHGSMKDKLIVDIATEIWLYEDGYFEIVNLATGTKYTDFWEQQATFTYLDEATASFAQNLTYGLIMYRSAQLVGMPAGGAVASGVGGGALGDTAQDMVKNHLGDYMTGPISAPLTTEVPAVGTVRVNAFYTHGDGTIWTLNFGWTPDMNLFLVRGWNRYK